MLAPRFLLPVLCCIFAFACTSTDNSRQASTLNKGNDATFNTLAILSKTSPVPGGVAIIPVSGYSQSSEPPTFNGRPVWMVQQKANQWVAVVGLPLDQKLGPTQVLFAGRAFDFTVHDKDYEESRVYLKNQDYVTPPATRIKRISTERQTINAQYRIFTPTQNPSLPFILPVAGPFSSLFGKRRFFNDQPRRPHSGLDIAVPEGEPVMSAATGSVTATGDFYFNGKIVFIDHGQGLITMYCHLSRIDVSAGQLLQQGDILGAVGKTGRVTGAHLHWSANLNGAMIDPLLLIAAKAR